MDPNLYLTPNMGTTGRQGIKYPPTCPIPAAPQSRTLAWGALLAPSQQCCAPGGPATAPSCTSTDTVFFTLWTQA